VTKALLTLNTTVPSEEYPGTPAVVVYDNGDWEIVFNGDVDYIAHDSSSFFCSMTFIQFFIELIYHYDLGDEDDLDVSDGVVTLFIEQPCVVNESDEPVLMIWADGQFEVLDRDEAESIFKMDRDTVANFIPVADLIADFQEWRGRMGDSVFPERDDDDDSVNVDEDPEDI